MSKKKFIYGKDNIPKPIRMYMEYWGFYGLTTFWTIYYWESKPSPRLVKHEAKHREQMEREGFWKFHIRYTYFWITKGYQDNPYEIEAREAEWITF